MPHAPAYSTPEREGISSTYILEFLKKIKAAGGEIHGILMSVNDKIIFEHYQAPYAKNIPHTTHSMTKCFTNTAFGLAYTNGLADIDDRVLMYFPQYEDKANEYLKSLTIRDLITMRSGQERKIQGNEWRPLKTSWIDAYFKVPWNKAPGTEFMYSSANSYIVSAIVQMVTGMSCDEYLKKHLTCKMGMRDFTWQKSPEGICSGGNGVDICADDMLKMGMLYLNEGRWDGEQLLDRHWVDLSLGYADPVRLNDGEPEYNFHWRHTGDIWASRGKFGQTCALIPSLNMAVSVMMASKEHIVADVLQKTLADPVLKGVCPNGTDEDNQADLKKYTDDMTLEVIPKDALAGREPLGSPQILRYRVADNADSVSAITIEILDDELSLSICDNRGIHTVKHGVDRWKDGYTSMTGHYLHHQYEYDMTRVCAAAYRTGSRELMLEWRYPGMPFWDHVRIDFTDQNSITVKRWVNMNSEGTERPEIKAARIG